MLHREEDRQNAPLLNLCHKMRNRLYAQPPVHTQLLRCGDRVRSHPGIWIRPSGKVQLRELNALLEVQTQFPSLFNVGGCLLLLRHRGGTQTTKRCLRDFNSSARSTMSEETYGHVERRREGFDGVSPGPHLTALVLSDRGRRDLYLSSELSLRHRLDAARLSQPPRIKRARNVNEIHQAPADGAVSVRSWAARPPRSDASTAFPADQTTRWCPLYAGTRAARGQ